MIDLYQTGAYCRTAGGNLERPDLQSPVVSWMAWSINADNGADGSPAAWNRCRTLWAANGIEHFPWMHCRSIEDVDRLISVGIGYNSPAIGLNIEDVVEDGFLLQEVAGHVLDFWNGPTNGRPVHMPTLRHVQNDQGWDNLSFVVAALELNSEFDASVALGEAKHAMEEGLPNVTFMYGTKLPPSAFDLRICHSLYTADDIAPTAEAWNSWKSGPCVKLGGVEMLTPTQKQALRAGITHYCLVAEEFERNWHYDQMRPYTGQGVAPRFLHRNDCSSYVALVFRYTSKHLGLPVKDPLGNSYKTGNTDSAYTFLKAHKAPSDKYRVGDIALYLQRAFPHHHMTICRKAGTGATAIFSSFGQESGPEPTKLHYRSDLTGVYRHPALL